MRRLGLLELEGPYDTVSQGSSQGMPRCPNGPQLSPSVTQGAGC